MYSFSIRNTTNQEILNELNYGLKTATTVITRYRNSEDLLLDDFNTIHYYVYDGAAVFDYSISTLVEVTDTSSCVTGLGYWLDDSTDSENFSPDSTNPPSYNTQSVWSKIGTLHFGIPNYSKWRIRVSRVVNFFNVFSISIYDIKNNDEQSLVID